jgi:hypothetical protein
VACTLELHTCGAAGSQEWCDSWSARDWAATAASLGQGCPSTERGTRGGRVERGGSKGGSEARFARLKFLMSRNIVECGG